MSARRRLLRLWGAIALALWGAYLAVGLLLPDTAGARTAPTAPLAAIVGAGLVGLVSWLVLALDRPTGIVCRGSSSAADGAWRGSCRL